MNRMSQASTTRSGQTDLSPVAALPTSNEPLKRDIVRFLAEKGAAITGQVTCGVRGGRKTAILGALAELVADGIVTRSCGGSRGKVFYGLSAYPRNSGAVEGDSHGHPTRQGDPSPRATAKEAEIDLAAPAKGPADHVGALGAAKLLSHDAATDGADHAVVYKEYRYPGGEVVRLTKTDFERVVRAFQMLFRQDCKLNGLPVGD